MESALYNRDILRLAASLVTGDRLENPDGSAEKRSTLCGSRVQADIAVQNGDVVSGIALRANACAIGQASAAILRANAVGMTVSAIAELRSAIAGGLNGTQAMPMRWPDLAVLEPAKDYPSRHAAILIPYDALLAAADLIPAR